MTDEAHTGRLHGRTALVTGGGRGIGRAIALELAREGADVAVAARTESEIEKVADEIRALGRRAEAVRMDALEPESPGEAVRRAVERLGSLDGLVNAAGGVVAPNGLGELLPFGHDDGLFVDNLTLNLTSAWRATQAALGPMRERGHGRILFIGSGYAKRSGGLLAYTTAKHGLVGLTRALAAQVAPFGITVNCLCPGWTNTQLVDWDVLALAYGTDPAGAKAMAESENLQRRILEPEELGPMAALLLADSSFGITGQVVSVDGGYKV